MADGDLGSAMPARETIIDNTLTMAPNSAAPEADPRPVLRRPKLETRKSSGSLIVPRDSPYVEVKEESYEEGDARSMSPRRSSNEIERMGAEARINLQE